jgi:hypothetical protein
MGKNNVYIFDFESQIKIGQSVNVKRRLRNIETQSGHEATRHFSIEADGGYETLMHRLLDEYRTVGEYFTFPFEYAVSILKSLVKYQFSREIKKDSQLFLPLVIEKTVSENDTMNGMTVNVIMTDSMNMTGLTIQEMSKKLGISEDAVYLRLRTAGIQPLTRQAIYPESALEQIREVSKGGRPKKK